MNLSLSLVANRCARQHGTNRATKIIITEDVTVRAVRQQNGLIYPFVAFFDPYHAESRTGIRAGMAALKRFWHTYHYVPSKCHVVVADPAVVYNDDDH